MYFNLSVWIRLWTIAVCVCVCYLLFNIVISLLSIQLEISPSALNPATNILQNRRINEKTLIFNFLNRSTINDLLTFQLTSRIAKLHKIARNTL